MGGLKKTSIPPKIKKTLQHIYHEYFNKTMDKHCF